MSIDAATPRDLVQSWVDAFNRADAEALADLYAEAAINPQVAEAPVHGRAAIRDMFASGFASATMVCIVENIFQDGEWAILEWRDPLGLRGCGFFHVAQPPAREPSPYRVAGHSMRSPEGAAAVNASNTPLLCSASSIAITGRPADAWP